VKHRSIGLIGMVLLAATISACGTASATPSPTPTPTQSPTTAPTPAPSIAPTATPAPTAPPAGQVAPTSVKLVNLPQPATCPAAYSLSCFAYKVTWTQPNPTGVTIKVYAVTKCLTTPHCIKSTTTIPSADLFQLASASASTGSLTFIVGDGESYGDGWVKSGSNTLYLYAVIVRAASAAGTSPNVIAWTQ
jgi:hypothetical protein